MRLITYFLYWKQLRRNWPIAQGGDPAAGDEEALELLDRATIYNNFTDPIGAAFFAGRQSLRAEYKGEDAKFIVEKYEQLDAKDATIAELQRDMEAKDRALSDKMAHDVRELANFIEDEIAEISDASMNLIWKKVHEIGARGALASPEQGVPGDG